MLRVNQARPSAVAANGGVASDTGKKAFKPANMVKAPTSPTATVEPKARAVLPPATSSSSGDKPTEGPSPVQISPDDVPLVRRLRRPPQLRLGLRALLRSHPRQRQPTWQALGGPCKPRASSQRSIFRRAPRALGSRSGQSRSRLACGPCGATYSPSIPHSWQACRRAACLHQTKSGS